MTSAETDGAFDRAAAIGRMATEQFDVLVVGGGITGAGVALDAASRGLRTALVERQDFGYGTSSKSSKMVHGGIRYLQQGDVKLVWQALRERRNLLKNAPHLVRPLGFMIPIYTKGGLIPKFLARLFRIVLFGYDLVGGASIVGRHKRLSRDEALALMPTLKSDRLHSALLYYDARTDDARLTLAIVRSAADHGAAVANYVRVTEVLKDGQGRATGARVDTGGGTVDVAARCVVNAAGVWIDDVAATDLGPGHEMMRPARGVHMTVPMSALQNRDVAVILAASGGPGSVFAVPWGEFAYVGTTDTDYSGPLDDPWLSGGDVGILLEHLNPSIRQPLAPDAVLGGWAGLRPLLRGEEDAKTADLSRRHRITRSPSGVVTIAGGKLTTYRRMAEDTVDFVLDGLGRKAACRTKKMALHGAAGQKDTGAEEHLRNRYGADAEAVRALVAADPGLGEPLVPGQPYLRAEAVYAAQHEMVVELDDVFSRRTRARLFARDATVEAAASVAALVAGPLGWSADEQAGQLARYKASVAAEVEAIRSAAAPATGARRVSEGWAPAVKLPRSLS